MQGKFNLNSGQTVTIVVNVPGGAIYRIFNEGPNDIDISGCSCGNNLSLQRGNTTDVQVCTPSEPITISVGDGNASGFYDSLTHYDLSKHGPRDLYSDSNKIVGSFWCFLAAAFFAGWVTSCVMPAPTDKELAARKVVKILSLSMPNNPRSVAGPVGAGVAVLSVWIAIFVPHHRKRCHWSVVVMWSIVPALYFMTEYGTTGIVEHQQLENLVHSQEIASHFWAAFGVLLAAIYSNRGFTIMGAGH
jgi:hypothetical protein